MQNAVRSGMGLLGMHPSASLAHPLHQPALAGQRMPGLMPLDVRANLLQSGAAGRFPLLMQPGPTQQGASLLDSALQAQARARAPFPLDPFSKPPGLSNDHVSKAEDEPPSGADEGKDQDYRFPPMEKPSTGLLRTPPREHREPLLGGGGGGGGGGRPPLLQTPGTQPGRTSLVGRLQALAGFTPDNRWNQIRGDFDERDGTRGGLQPPVGPKGFPEERSASGQNFPSRFDSHPGPTGGAAGGSGNHGGVGGAQAWNRTGGATAAFDSERHQDLDERRRPWDRQRDRDERDFDFRREMNGSRHSRERDRDRGRDRKDHERDPERDKDRERERDHGSWAPLLPLPTPLLPTPPLNPNLTMNQGKLLAPLKMNPQLQQRFQSPLLAPAQSKPLLHGLNQPPQAMLRPPSQSPTVLPESKSESPAPAESPQPQSSPSSHHFPQSKSPISEARAEAEPSLHPGSPPQTGSSQATTQCPSKLISSPESKTPSETSPPYEAPCHDASAAFAQAATPPQDSPCSLEEQKSPQENEEDAQERSSPPQLQWVNGPGTDSGSVAESTPEPSPGSSPESLLPASEAEQQEQPFAFAKDVDSDQSEPMEDSTSQPVLDSVTDTEGT